MVAYRNTRTGRVVHMAEPLPSMERSRRWERVEEEAKGPQDVGAPAEPVAPWPVPDPAPDGLFDPGEHTVAQVNAYLADAGRDERLRVLAEEAEGRGRRGILSGPHSDLSGA